MSDFAKELSDLMASYNAARTKWIANNGSPNGFDTYIFSEMLERSQFLARYGLNGDEAIDLPRFSKWADNSKGSK